MSSAGPMPTYARPRVFFGTPRKLPKPQQIPGRVVVLDIAFAADGTGASFEKVTKPFLDGLGARLAMWVDHHDHQLHAEYSRDERFVLRSKRQHGACPEMVTRERVDQAGPVDSVVCHNDLDGIYAAAKWIRGGDEPYAGADDDARVIDTCVGTASPLAATIDRAMRVNPKDDTFRERVLWFLVQGATDKATREEFEDIARAFETRLGHSKRLAEKFVVDGPLAVVDATGFSQRVGPYDKTETLLLGQRLAPVSVVYDEHTVTAAAAFDSGIDLCALLGLSGGMPTRVSVARSRLDDVLSIGPRIAREA